MNEYDISKCGLKSIIFTKFMGVFGILKQHKNLISHGPNSRYTIVYSSSFPSLLWDCEMCTAFYLKTESQEIMIKIGLVDKDETVNKKHIASD